MPAVRCWPWGVFSSWLVSHDLGTARSSYLAWVGLVISAAQKISEISSSILVRELIVSPHSENPGLLLPKYREYLQKLYSLNTWCLTEQTNVLRSNTTSNRINHTACQIWPTMLHISCALINSSTLKTSSISTNSWGPELFKTLQETSYIRLGVKINFSFMIHLMPTWYFESFWTHHPYDNIINIKVHKYFALCLKIS